MYDFENKDLKEFNQLTGDQMKMVIDGMAENLTDIYTDCLGWHSAYNSTLDIFSSVYRVKSEPYSLEDALSDAASICARRPSQVTTKENAEYMNIIRKLSASLEASK